MFNKDRRPYALSCLIRVMKLTTFFLLFTFISVSASVYSQVTKLDLKVQSVTVKEALSRIEDQSQYFFMYNDRKIDVDRKVDIDLRQVKIEDLLRKIFAGTDTRFLIKDRQIVLYNEIDEDSSLLTTLSSSQKQKSVTGKVSDTSKVPLPGVSVVIKGTTVGTITDSDGNYSLSNVPENAILQYSFVGMKAQEIPVENKNSINVTLTEETVGIEEVVAVGYGTQKKADMTGSVSTVKGGELVKAPSPNLATSLTGKMTGVITTQHTGEPGKDDPTFFIRGKSTFGDNTALILVDGVERSLNRLNPNEIESVTILKDAASAAVYGARAANGVILITTKRGAVGKPKISYTGSTGYQTPAIMPKLMNAYEYATYLNNARANQGDLPRFSDSEIQDYKSGKLPSTNWWNETFSKKAPIKQHNISVDGGTDNTKYFVSLGFLDQDGLYALSNYKKYNVRSNIDVKITKDFRIGIDLAGRNEKTMASPIGDGIFATVMNSKPTESAYVPETVEPDGLGSNGMITTPIGLAERAGYNRTNTSVFQSTLQSWYTFPFVKGLTAKFSFSYDRTYIDNKVYNTPFDFYVYDKVNDLYSKYSSAGQINLTQQSAQSTLQTLQTSLTYDRTFGKHSISALMLMEKIQSDSENISAYREGYISPAIDQIFAGGDLNKNNGGAAFESARLGYVGRVNYDFNEKYLVQANFRYDGSFNFPKDKRWGFFPAFSVGWKMNNEPFLKAVEFISNLKLRASYGEYGNDRVSPYQYLSGFNFGSGSIFGNGYNTGITESVIPNPNITWETAISKNIGIDFGIFNGKISGEFDYFYKRTKDILLPRNASVPQTFGATLPYENIGIVDNKGIEGLLRYKDSFGGVKVMIEGNLTYAKSKVIFMDEPATVEDRLKRTGQPFDQFYGLKAEGLFQSQAEIDGWAVQDGNGNTSIKTGDIKYQDFNNDKVIDGKDIHRVGKSDIPEIIFGLNLNLEYKGFSLSANFQGATGFEQYLRYDPFNLEGNAFTIFKDSWTPENTGAKYPRLYSGIKQNNTQSSSFWLYDATYVKLRNLEFSYTFNQIKVFEKIGITNLRLFVSGNNLLTISRIKGFDPEIPHINPGSNPFYYPQMKMFNAGINLEF